ncbi:MAG TPA: STAS/SEC14 domain-containing protein [Polyangiales bacterium]|nr:STAS/SEC14 domain-containing protein [Polyangiales bacterium]
MPLVIDRKNLPMLQLRYVGDFSDAELTEFLRELDEVLKLPGRKVCVFDLAKATTGTPRQRQIQGAWIAKNEDALARGFAAAAIVTESAIIRGAVTAIFWIRPLPFPTRVVATLEAADEWLAPYRAALG